MRVRPFFALWGGLLARSIMRPLVVIKTFKDFKKTCDLFSCKRYQRYAAPTRLPRRSRTHPGNAFWAHFCQGGLLVGLILPKSLLSLWSSCFLFQNKKYFCFVKDIHEYAARRRLLGRSPDAPQTLQDTPWRCFWGSHLLRRPLGMHHIVKVLMKFAVFRFLFQKNDLVVVFLGAGSLLKTKRS